MTKQLTTPFTIVIDSNEQEAGESRYDFTTAKKKAKDQHREREVPTVVKKIFPGDYSIEGHEHRICFERKTLSDLYGSFRRDRSDDRDDLRTNYERLRDEVEAMKGFNFAYVIVEASWPMICDPVDYYPLWRSKLHPNSVAGTINSWAIKYPWCGWVFAGSRQASLEIVYDRFEKYWEHAASKGE